MTAIDAWRSPAFFSAGMDAYISKPIRLHELAQVLVSCHLTLNQSHQNHNLLPNSKFQKIRRNNVGSSFKSRKFSATGDQYADISESRNNDRR
jgi:hypothetical protein